MSLAIYAAIESKSALLIVMVALSLMVKKTPSYSSCLGRVGGGSTRSTTRTVNRRGFGCVAMIDNWLIIPGILGSSSFYSSYLPFGGVTGIISTLFHRPGQLFSYLGSQGRPFYLWQIASTVGFVFLFSPEIAAIGVLLVVENDNQQLRYMHQILYQYSIVLAPILALGVLYAIAQQSTLWRRNALAIVALTAPSGRARCGVTPHFPTTRFRPNRRAEFHRCSQHSREEDPTETAVVSAWYPLVSHVDNRSQIYVWPTPFYAETGDAGLTPVPDFASRAKCEYLLLPVPLTPVLTRTYSKGSPAISAREEPRRLRTLRKDRLSVRRTRACTSWWRYGASELVRRDGDKNRSTVSSGESSDVSSQRPMCDVSSKNDAHRPSIPLAVAGLLSLLFARRDDVRPRVQDDHVEGEISSRPTTLASASPA